MKKLFLAFLFVVLLPACDRNWWSEKDSDTVQGTPFSSEQDEKVCQFKEDHVDGELQRSESGTLPDVIKEKTIWGRDDFTVQSTVSQNNGVVRTYHYDRGEDYGSWCSELEDCVVQVIYSGNITERQSGGRVAFTGLKKWEYADSLTVQVNFSGKLLDFSGCAVAE